MLRTMVEQHHCKFMDRVPNWQEAIRQSCGLLEADGCVDASYAELIIDCVRRYGPYIIIIPNVCLAHSQEHPLYVAAIGAVTARSTPAA